eukprot:SM000030S11467  [mRNA]  locus=s30:953802:959389:+ [translate_table: standard]
MLACAALLEKVMADAKAYMEARTELSAPAFCPFPPSPAGPDSTEDYVADLWKRVQALQASGWSAESVPKLADGLLDEISEGHAHAFPELVRPELPEPPSDRAIEHRQHHEARVAYPRRVGRMRIFPPTKTESGLHPIDRFIVEEYIMDVLFYINGWSVSLVRALSSVGSLSLLPMAAAAGMAFVQKLTLAVIFTGGSRKECAAYLVGLPVPFRYEHILAEAIFAQLLLLPRPPFRAIYYTIVMVDLCKALPGAFPPVVASAVRALFHRMVDLDVECRSRLVQWLSHHLSNFQFVWPWEEWSHVLQQAPWSPQRLFCAEVLEKELRLSHWDRVKESLEASPAMVRLLPPRGPPAFKFGKGARGSEEEVKLAGELVEFVQEKRPTREVQAWLESTVKPSLGPGRTLALVMHTLLHLGTKSITHTFTALERFHVILSQLAPTHDDQAALLACVEDFWQVSPQMAVVVIDRLMGIRVVSSLAISSFSLSPQNGPRIHTSDHLWEVLHNAISKTSNRTTDVRKQVASAQQAAAALIAAASRASVQAEAAAAAVASSEGGPGEDLKVRQAEERARSLLQEAASAQAAASAKKAVLEDAQREQEALFLAVCKGFVTLLDERLRASSEQAGNGPAPMQEEQEEDEEVGRGEGIPSDNANGLPRKVQENGSGSRWKRKKKRGRGPEEEELAEAQEEEEWQGCVLGHLRAIVRHYSGEVWAVAERLRTEVVTEAVHPSIAAAVWGGLGVPQAACLPPALWTTSGLAPGRFTPPSKRPDSSGNGQLDSAVLLHSISSLHVLVLPRRVAPRYADLTAEEATDLWLLAKRIGCKLENHHQATSLTFTIQDGPQAGQTVPHVHIHILPRRDGDFKKNDDVYDAVDESEKLMSESAEKLDLDKETKSRSVEDMAAEATTLARLFESS